MVVAFGLLALCVAASNNTNTSAGGKSVNFTSTDEDAVRSDIEALRDESRYGNNNDTVSKEDVSQGSEQGSASSVNADENHTATITGGQQETPLEDDRLPGKNGAGDNVSQDSEQGSSPSVDGDEDRTVVVLLSILTGLCVVVSGPSHYLILNNPLNVGSPLLQASTTGQRG